MTASPERPSGGRLYARVVVVVAALAVALSAYLGRQLYRDAVSMSAAPLDNVQWTLSRLEMETLRLQQALADQENTLATVRKRFDIFYSRVDVFRRGDAFAPLRADPDAGRGIAAFSDFLAEVTPIIDGPDATLAAARPDLARRLDEMRDLAAEITLGGIALYSRQSDARREAFERLVLAATVLAVSLITVLAATLLALASRSRVAVRKEREAEASGARLKAVVEVALDPIIVADARGRVVEFNAAAERVLGYDREEARGADLATLMIPCGQREAHWAAMARCRDEGERRVVGKGRIELEAVRKSGERFAVELAVGEVPDGGARPGEPIFVGFLRDISGRKAAEVELMNARDAAMAADRAKSDFIAVMSHEMRTPLNGVLGVLDLLSDTELTTRQGELVEVATRSGEILLRHINDVLDITRIEARRMEISLERLDIAAILDEVVAVGRPGAASRGVRVEAATDLPEHALLGDAHRIRQVLLNLVGNAVKFTVKGRVDVRADRIGGSAVADLVEFSVRDTGPGIAPEDQRRIFDDFVMVDAEYSREAGGSGLGLSICRRIVKAMGGEIGVESVLGQGSRFWFRIHLPHAPAEGAESLAEGAVAAEEAIAASAPLDVLVVEDNEVNRMVARRMLAAAGHRVTEAKDGLEGVEIATAWRFDVILMDISMPRLDGLEATRRIKAAGASARTPVIGVTAHAAPAEQQSFRDAGMDACLTKPLRRDAMLRMLAGLRRDDPPAAESHAAPTSAADEQAGSDAIDEGCENGPPIVDEDVFDEFVASLPGDALQDMITRVGAELTTAAASLPEVELCDALAAHAHKAAGSAALVGAARAHAALSAVEAAAKSGRRDVEAIAAAQAEMAEAVSVLREFAA